MISPAQQKVIQIEITNACANTCANCTRFCGHYQTPFFMDFDTFKRAVASMQGYEGILGIMGGEPTLHPQFGQFIEYFGDHFGGSRTNNARQPIANFVNHVVQNVFDINHHNGRGLWSSLTKKYYDNFEVIQEVFGYQAINDHQNPSKHQALMITRRELGIPDDEWVKLRDRCWIQNLWSASITPKGCFFCEVAGALDMLFDGPGGWPIEPGWWRRKPSEFGEQLQWCELCSAALGTPMRYANEEVDDVSPVLLEMLKNVHSPKVRKGKVVLFDPVSYDAKRSANTQVSIPYLDDQSKRISTHNTVLNPKKIEAIIICSDVKELSHTLPNNRKFFDDLVVIDVSGELTEVDAALVGKVVVEGTETLTAETLNHALSLLSGEDWILVCDATTVFSDDFRQRIARVTLNPGCLYDYTMAESVREGGLAHRTGNSLEFAFDDKLFYLFNLRAIALRGCPDGVFSSQNLEGMFPLQKWPENKRIDLVNTFDAHSAISGGTLRENIVRFIKRFAGR